MKRTKKEKVGEEVGCVRRLGRKSEEKINAAKEKQGERIEGREEKVREKCSRAKETRKLTTEETFGRK